MDLKTWVSFIKVGFVRVQINERVIDRDVETLLYLQNYVHISLQSSLISLLV